MRATLLSFALLVIFPAAAQVSELRVRTREAPDDRPLPFVNVQVEGTPVGGTTDDRGLLRLSLKAGTYELVASYLGYGSGRVTVRIPEESEVSIRLTPTGENLGTVTVSANDLRDRLERPTIGVERLSMSEIEALPVALGEVDVLRGLQLYSGVSSAGEASNGLSVRGGTVDQNLILLDGAPVFTPTHLFGLFSVFTPDAVGGVDLYRANVPARFGGRVASVLDVRSRTPTSDRLKWQGGIGIVSSHLAVETPLTRDKKLKLLAAGRAGFNDFVFRWIDRLKNTRSRFADGTLRLRYTANERDILSYSGFISRDFYQVDLISQFAGIVSEVNQNDYGHYNSTLEWLRTYSAATSLQLRATRSDFRPRVFFPQRDDDRRVEYDARILHHGARLVLDHRSGGNHRLQGGIEAAIYTLSPGRLRPNGVASVTGVQLADERGTELTLFAEDEWKVSDRLSLSAGLRYTQYLQLGPGEQRRYAGEGAITPDTRKVTVEFAGSEVMQRYGGAEPRLAVNYAIFPRLSFKTAYSRTKQYLQNVFNSTTPLPSSRWKVSDNNLRPQRADLWSSGLFWLPGDGRYGFGLEGYYRRTANVLEYRPGADFFLSPAVEADLLQGTGEAYGIEASISRKAGPLTGEINYAFARAFNRVSGATLATSVNLGDRYPGYFDQPHTANAHVVYDDGKTHRIGFNLVVQTNRPYSAPSGILRIDGQAVPLFLRRNNARLPVYHRLDFNWTIHNARMKKRRWVGDWTFTVYNLYGRKNAYNIYYLPRDYNRMNQTFGSSPLGSYRLTIFGAPILSLSYSFKFE